MDYAFKIIDLLRIESKPWQLAGAITLGMMAGLTPTLTMHGLGLFLLIFIIRIHMPLALFSFAFFKILGRLLTTPIDYLGRYILTFPPLEDMWAWFYHSRVFPFTRFYNSVVMGSLVISVLIGVPLFFFLKYRFAKIADRIPQKIADSRFRTSRFYRHYVEYLKHKA